MFVPSTGDLFYCTKRPLKSQHLIREDFGNERVATVVSTDSSYSTDVFKCVARDDTLIIAERFIGMNFSSASLVRFRISQWTYDPVGPEIRQYIKAQEQK